jgi:hypothetical protein
LPRLLDRMGRFEGVWITRRLDIARHRVANVPVPVADSAAP